MRASKNTNQGLNPRNSSKATARAETGITFTNQQAPVAFLKSVLYYF